MASREDVMALKQRLGLLEGADYKQALERSLEELSSVIDELKAAEQDLKEQNDKLLIANEALRDTEDELQRQNEMLSTANGELKVAEEELKSQNESLKFARDDVEAERRRYQELFDMAPDCCLVTDLYGSIKEANRAAYELLRQNMLVGKPLPIFIAEGYRKRFYYDLEMIREGKQVQGFETGIRGSAESGPVPVRASLSILRSEAGRSASILWVIHDVTESKQAEEEMAHAMDAAQATARVKSEFMANMSHEIRTPMNAVIGMTGLLMDTGLSDEQRDFVQTIRSSGESLMRIIDDILDFSKMESGRLKVVPRTFNLRSVIEESIDLVAARAAEKGLEIGYEIEPGVPESVVSDPSRLGQILANLLSNAVKFTDSGSISISAAGRKEACGYRLFFIVSDTGIGIPECKMDRLFKSFSQIDSSSTRSYGGTGLGLAISKSLVETMGGEIWVRSTPGEGSRFHFTIMAQEAPCVYGPDLDTSAIRGRRVILYEESGVSRRSLEGILASWGVDALAFNGANPEYPEADAAIVDISSPEGQAAAREMEVRFNIPVVSISPMASTPGAVGGAAIQKPVKAAKLFEALRRVFLTVTEAAVAVEPVAGRRHLRVLLAEDNAVNRKVAVLILKKLGHMVDAVSNGLEVLEAVARKRYDVILMDVQMPQMDGLEATRQIRMRWPDGPEIIAMTAYALDGDREMCIDAGMDDYIVKPVRAEDLARVLELVGGGGRAADEWPSKEQVIRKEF